MALVKSCTAFGSGLRIKAAARELSGGAQVVRIVKTRGGVVCDPQPIQNHKLLPALLRPASPAATSRQQHTSPPTEAACGGQLIPVFPSNLPCGAKNPHPVPCSLTSACHTNFHAVKLTLCDVVQSFQSRQFEDPSVRDGLVPDQRRGTSARGLGQRKQSRRVHNHRHASCIVRCALLLWLVGLVAGGGRTSP